MEQHEITEEHHHRRAGWSRRCPFCLSKEALHADRAGVMTCACGARLAPPPDRDLEPRLPGEQGMPRWDGDERLLAEWDRYSRPGLLVEEWGSSTRREDGAPPRERDGGEEERPPRIREQALRGRQDDILDALVRGYVDQTQALRDAIDAVKVAVLRSERAKADRRAQPTTRGPTCAEVLLDHLGELDGKPASTLMGSDPRPTARASGLVAPARTSRPRETAPAWFAALSSACCGALRSQVNALVILAVNALRKRGVEYLDSLDLVSPRVEREEPFANMKHALSVALGGGGQLGGSSPRLAGARAKHKTPSGMVFGRIAIAPSHSSSGRAPGEDGVIEALDARSALASVRVGRRFEARDGKQVEVDPGRPLDDVELELLELVDRGEIKASAKVNKRGRVIQEAIEPVAIRDVVAKLRDRGLPDRRPEVPREFFNVDTGERGVGPCPDDTPVQITEKQARQALGRSRRGLEEALRERGLIPQARPRSARSRAPEPRPQPLGPTVLPSHLAEAPL